VCLFLALAGVIGVLAIFFLIMCFSARGFGPLASFNNRHINWGLGISDEYRDAMLDQVKNLNLSLIIESEDSNSSEEKPLFNQTLNGSQSEVLNLITKQSYLNMNSWPGYANRGKYVFWSPPSDSPGYTVSIPRTVSQPTTYTFQLKYGSCSSSGDFPSSEENVSWFTANFSVSSYEVQANDGSTVYQMRRPAYIFFVYRPSPFGQVFLSNFSELESYYDTSGLFEEDFIGVMSVRVIFAHLDDPYLYAACTPFREDSGWREFITFLILLLVAALIAFLWLFSSKIVSAIFDARREYDRRESARRAAGPKGNTVVIYKRRYPRTDDFNYSRNQYPPLLY